MDFLGPATSKLEDLLEWTLFWTGLVLTSLGLIGAIILILGYKIRDQVLMTSFTFVSFYMLGLGVFLLLYRKKLVVRSQV